MENEIMVGKFQGGDNFGFFIPDNREEYGGDFYVSKNNFLDAKDGDKVEARELKKFKGKKPEAKIISVLTGKQKTPKKIFVEGVYSGGDGNFGFIDIEGQEKGYFVYGNKKSGAVDGDKVKAELVDFKGKKEAIVTEILDSSQETVTGRFKDNDRFGFVITNDGSGDIFIAGSRKAGAEDGDTVEVKIIKKGGKNPEGVILKILS